MQTERIKAAKQQTEQARADLITLSTSHNNPNPLLKEFAANLAAIITIWQKQAKDSNPLDFDIKLAKDSPVSLLEVLTLVPEEFQQYIAIKDPRRSATEGLSNLSWLCERTMNALVELARDDVETHYFARGMASNLRDSIDQVTQSDLSVGWLKNQVLQMRAGNPRNTWNPDEVYTIPASAMKFVFFFNYTEAHWTLIATDVNKQKWSHGWYNSAEAAGSNKYKGPTWNAVVEQLPKLEQLILGASGLEVEAKKSGVKKGKSAQQVNSFDCGIITVYNAIEILSGRVPEQVVDTKKLRLDFLSLIRETLDGMDG